MEWESKLFLFCGKISPSDMVKDVTVGRGRELGSWIQSVYCRAPALELSGVIVIILMPESYNV